MKTLLYSLVTLLILSTVSYANDKELTFLYKNEKATFYLINSSVSNSGVYKQASTLITATRDPIAILTNLYDCKSFRRKTLHMYSPAEGGYYEDVSNQENWETVININSSAGKVLNIICSYK